MNKLHFVPFESPSGKPQGRRGLLLPGIRILAVLGAVLAPDHSVMAASYTVQGRFTYSLFKPEGTNNPLHRRFDLRFDDCQWQVRVVLDGPSRFAAFRYEYDGINLVYSSETTGPVADSGMVEACPVPQRWTSAAGELPWLAFASGCYFQEATNGLALSFEALRSRNGTLRRMEVPVRLDLSKEPPWLPSHVQYVCKELLVLQDDGTISTNSLAAQVGQAGYVKAEYRALAFTNLGGYAFPVAFEYREYRPFRTGRSQSDIRHVLTIEGTATNIALAGNPPLPAPSKTVYVRDLRTPEPLTQYPVTNGLIPETNSAEVLAARTRAQRLLASTAADTRPGSVGVRLVMAGAMLAFFTLPLVFLWRRRRGSV